jgi:hypothetical protein
VGCEEWGTFFKLNIARGRQYLDKNGTQSNPSYNPEYNAFYKNDRDNMILWCSHIKKFEVTAASTEWSPGTKKGKNQYLHAHFMVTVEHDTRLQIDIPALAEYFQEKAQIPWKPYIHVDAVPRSIENAMKYIGKNEWNKSVPEAELIDAFEKLNLK